jgi:uncharacterized membrane-anchored protein
MKKVNLTLTLLLCLTTFLFAQQTDSLQLQFDSLEKSFTYKTGTIQLDGGIGYIEVPKGFKYLDAEQSAYVLYDLWGNPQSTTLGMLFPENDGVMTIGSYVFNIQYDELGYVKDDDAGKINYDDLLKDMKEEMVEANKERAKEGYPTVELIGWAASPSYDANKKVLYWAKELKFEESDENTLNYNVRILGRKGVMVLNAIADMNALPEVNNQIPNILNSFHFTQGNQYGDFNPDVDEVAAWTIGGLVAGKVLAKAGFFALILKFWKVIGIAVIAGGTALWKRIRNKKDEEDESNPDVPLSPEPVNTHTNHSITNMEQTQDEQKDNVV